MAEKTREYLKSKFETGDRPSQTDFADAIDSDFNKTDDNASDISDGGGKVIMTDAERTKLTGVEAGAEVNPGAGEVKTLYESNTNTNVYDDASKIKLDNMVEPQREWAGICDFSSPPSINMLSSTFDNNIIISNVATGVYELSSSGSEFDPVTTIVSITGNDSGWFAVVVNSTSIIQVVTYNDSGVATDGLMTTSLIKIEVY